MWTLASKSWTKHEKVARATGDENRLIGLLDFETYDTPLALKHNTVDRQWKMQCARLQRQPWKSKYSSATANQCLEHMAETHSSRLLQAHMSRPLDNFSSESHNKRPEASPKATQSCSVDDLHEKLSVMLEESRQLRETAEKVLPRPKVAPPTVVSSDGTNTVDSPVKQYWPGTLTTTSLGLARPEFKHSKQLEASPRSSAPPLPCAVCTVATQTEEQATEEARTLRIGHESNSAEDAHSGTDGETARHPSPLADQLTSPSKRAEEVNAETKKSASKMREKPKPTKPDGAGEASYSADFSSEEPSYSAAFSVSTGHAEGTYSEDFSASVPQKDADAIESLSYSDAFSVAETAETTAPKADAQPRQDDTYTDPGDSTYTQPGESVTNELNDDTYTDPGDSLYSHKNDNGAENRHNDTEPGGSTYSELEYDTDYTNPSDDSYTVSSNFS